MAGLVESAVSPRTVLLVEDGSGVTALAAARDLAAGGWRVAVGAPGGRSPATASRACAVAGAVRPLVARAADAWWADVRVLVARVGADLVVPCGDAELLVLSAGRERLQPAVLPYPGHAAVELLLDKAALAAAAAEAGLAVPHTEPAEPGRSPSFPGPAVVKPRLHGPAVGPGRVEAAVTAGGAAALAAADAVRAAGADPLYQRAVDGTLTALVCVRGRAGTTLAVSYQRADRVYPYPAGSCVRGALTEPPPGLLAAAERLLAAAGWWGLVQLELVEDGAGRAHLVDANPRPYGTLALADAAGPGLCDAWLRDAVGEPVAPTGARRGAVLQALGPDLRRALRHPSGGAGAAARLADLAGTLALSARRPVRPVWAPRDPGPAVAEARVLARRLLARRRRPSR